MLADWPRRASQGSAFVDPMCGSGTLAIEAAMIAANIPPAWSRDYFGFTAWRKHDASLWLQLRNDERSMSILLPVIILLQSLKNAD